MASNNSDKLAVYLHRAKGSADAAARAANQALDDTELFVYGELLELDTVKALAGSKHDQTFKQLELLAYGTFTDYKADSASFGELSEARLRKLKQLSLVSLAESTRTLTYKQLLSELDIANNGDLEELVVSCIYGELIVAALDQKRQQVEVQRVMGRDVHPSKLPTLLSKLDGWLGACDALLQKQQSQATSARAAVARATLLRDEHTAQTMQRSEQLVKDIESGDLATKRKAAAEKAMAAAGGSKGGRHREGPGGFSDRDPRFAAMGGMGGRF